MTTESDGKEDARPEGETARADEDRDDGAKTAKTADASEGDSLERLLEMMADGDAQVRGMVATAFSRVKDPRTVEPLVSLLADEDAHVRSAAAQALGAQGDERAVRPLMDAAHNMDDAALRANSIAALAHLAHPSSFNTVVAALFDLDDAVRRNAAVATGKLHDARAVEPLVMLLDDADPKVRANAAWALGELGDQGATDGLASALDRELDAKARSSELVALGRLATPQTTERVLTEATAADTTPNSRIAALIASVDCATQRLADDPEEALRIAERLVPTLLSLLRRDGGTRAAEADDAEGTAGDDTDADELRATAAWAVGHLPLSARSRAQAAACLVDALHDPYRWVVSYAVESLAILRDPASEQALRDLAHASAASEDHELADLAAKAADVVAGTATMPGLPDDAPSGL